MEIPPPRPRHQPWISQEEWEQRLQLAACLRLFAALGWNDGMFNQVSVRLVGDAQAGPQYIVNPVGLAFEQASAGKLVKVDSDGALLSPTRFQADAQAFAPIARVHGAREDALCVMFLQTPVAVAVASRQGGLRCDSFYSAQLIDRLGHIDFATWERPRSSAFVTALGEHDAFVLRQRGLLSLGVDLASAYWLMWTLQRACEVQQLGDASGQPPLPMDADLARSFAARSPLQQPDVAEQAFGVALRRHGISYADLGE